MNKYTQQRYWAQVASFHPIGRKGVTLLETLLAIAVVAILASVLVVVVGVVRSKAHGVTCRSNLQQLHSAIMLYVQENNGELPPAYDASTGETWASALMDGGYIERIRIAEGDSRNSILGCPVQQDWVDDPLARTYGYNRSVGSSTTRRRMTSLVDPSRTLLMADGHYTEGATVPFNIALSTAFIPTPTHNVTGESIHCLYADGHVGGRDDENSDAGFPRGVGAPGSARYLFWTGR